MAKPIFTAVAAVSIDGRIAAYQGQNTAWTSKEDKRFLHKFLDQSDVVLVGRTTYEIARKPLSRRNCIVLTSRVKNSIRKNPRLLFCNPGCIDLFSLVQRQGYKKVAVLGGQKVYSFCLQQNLLNELYLTIEPVVFAHGLNLFEIKGSKITKFKLINFKKLNSKGSLLLHYKIN